MVAAAVGGAGVLSAGAQIGGSAMAADAQTNAANQATRLQEQEFQTLESQLAPYTAVGGQAENMLSSNLASLTAPITMNQAQLEQTPGYQFDLNQGLKSTQNSAAARGLGDSGAALKGAASYTTGLAQNTYEQQFQNAVTNQSNTFNRLMGLTSLGENAAAGVGTGALSTGQSVGSNLIGAGNAVAGAANSAASGVGSSANNAVLANLLFGSGGGGGSAYNSMTPAQQVAQDVSVE